MHACKINNRLESKSSRSDKRRKMDRLEEDPLAVPRAPMIGDEPVLVNQPDFLHRGIG
jgi:hypothetical protein